MTREEVTKHLNILLANRCWNCRYERAGNKVCDEKCVFKQAVNEAIEALTRPKGEWLSVEIIDDDSYNGVNEDAAECSVCGYVSESYYWAKTYYKFCPNCGARMKGGDTE